MLLVFNEEIMQQLDKLYTSIDMVIKQNRERVNMVVHQHSCEPMYKEPYFEEDACFIDDSIVGF